MARTGGGRHSIRRKNRLIGAITVGVVAIGGGVAATVLIATSTVNAIRVSTAASPAAAGTATASAAAASKPTGKAPTGKASTAKGGAVGVGAGPAVASKSPHASASASPAAVAVGSAQPRVVRHGDDAEFTITCPSASTSAIVTGTSIGVPKSTPMQKESPTLFQFDLIVPDSAARGKLPVTMTCSDGSSAEVTIIVSSG